MADAHDNVDKSGLQPFRPGESGNPDGRPRKMIAEVLDQLDEVGIENVTKQQVIGVIETLLNLREFELKEYSEDKGHSMLIRIVAQYILDSQKTPKLMEFLLERAFGKPTNNVDLRAKQIIPDNFKIVVSDGD